MRIADSSVLMTSGRQFESYASSDKAVMEVRSDGSAKVMERAAAVYESSGSSMTSALNTVQQEAQREEKQQHQAQELQNAHQILNSMARPQVSASDIQDAVRNLKKTLLEQLLDALKGRTSRMDSLQIGGMKRGNVLDLRTSAPKMPDVFSRMFSAGAQPGFSAGTTASGTVWKRITASSASYSERETTSFQSQGFAVTQDGRTFRLDVAFSMSRSFTANYDSLTSEEFIMTDPLIINLDSNVTSVGDAKFSFDLDADGQKEEISFAGEGSGFLALDRNGNGMIDDGSELFGTESGNGFADLAAYDEDGNHWIDENDSIYEKLRVWTKDANGADRLMTLKEADVGAICLESADTEFSLNSAGTNETNGIVRRTGIYLRESGSAGTLSHVDLRC